MQRSASSSSSDEPDHANGNGSALALWAGLTALFTNLAAVGILDFFATPTKKNTAIAAVITSFVIGGSVYSRERYNDVKARRRSNGR